MNRRSFLLTLPIAGSAVAADANAPDLSLGVIADPQYADKPTAGSRHYRASIGKLKQCVNELNRRPLNAVVTLGDFIDEQFESFEPINAIYADLKPDHLKVPGNHDFSVAAEKKGEVLGALGLERGYSSWVIGSYRIVLLDGTEVSPYRPEHADTARKWMARLRKDGRKNGQPYNGGLSETQFAWLEKELESATSAKERVILCCHYPVLPEDPHNLWNDREVVALIDDSPCVVAWFNGHNHKGNYATRNGCHYVNFKGMVETADRTAYAIVRCYPNRIEIEGFDSEPDRKLGEFRR
ncbi:phosphatase [Haloferula helveola]|uniref:Phosphatase n=1 Tax=Haloferula helveola TaxID=490095 RepID=A0ABN6H0V2_9BACT|nr:phosphatase [Haloferula helveola]